MSDILLSDLTHFHDRQLLAYQRAHQARYLLYGGAMGGGKSYWLRWTLIGLLMELSAKYKLRGLRAMLGCETYTALRDRQIVRILQEFPKWLGRWKESTHE